MVTDKAEGHGSFAPVVSATFDMPRLKKKQEENLAVVANAVTISSVLMSVDIPSSPKIAFEPGNFARPRHKL